MTLALSLGNHDSLGANNEVARNPSNISLYSSPRSSIALSKSCAFIALLTALVYSSKMDSINRSDWQSTYHLNCIHQRNPGNFILLQTYHVSRSAGLSFHQRLNSFSTLQSRLMKDVGSDIALQTDIIASPRSYQMRMAPRLFVYVQAL